MNRLIEDVDLEKLDDSQHLLQMLLDFERVLDANDVYVFRNWLGGEIARGPIVRRHWITVDLRYPYHRMPDPRAALRLLKHGIQVRFNKMKQEMPGDITRPDYEPNQPTDWMVTIVMPRRLIQTTAEGDLEVYDDEVDEDDVEAAKDIGLDDESSYQQQEQLPNQDMMNQEMPPPGGPGAPPNAPPG